MPVKYKIRKRKASSDYESDSGTHYSLEEQVGAGSHGKARRCKPRYKHPTRTQYKVKEPKIVISPLKDFDLEPHDFEEPERKFLFFSIIYPQKKSNLIKIHSKKGSTYRLILPEIPGQPYFKVMAEQAFQCSIEKQVALFISAVQALKDCHQKKLVVVDVKADNIFYDLKSNKSFLIDGGFSARINYPIHSLFGGKSRRQIINRINNYPWLAPECWQSGKAPGASCAMDIYALGHMMLTKITNKNPPTRFDTQLRALCQQCLNREAQKRPSLEDLEKGLQQLFTEIINEGINNDIKVSFKDYNTVGVIHAHEENLKLDVNVWKKEACLIIKLLGVKMEPAVNEAALAKLNEIEYQATIAVQVCKMQGKISDAVSKLETELNKIKNRLDRIYGSDNNKYQLINQKISSIEAFKNQLALVPEVAGLTNINSKFTELSQKYKDITQLSDHEKTTLNEFQNKTFYNTFFNKMFKTKTTTFRDTQKALGDTNKLMETISTYKMG